jgi:hypothetical protein
MRHDAIFLVLYLLIIGALPLRTCLDKASVIKDDKASVVAKPDNAGPQAVGSIGKEGLMPDCEKELRRIPDLLRFFANRIQMGEETQSVVADMRQQEKKISAVCK